jgi:hypothetical protein
MQLLKWKITLVLINWYNVLQAQEVNEIQSKNKYTDNLKDLVDEYVTTNVQNQNRR